MADFGHSNRSFLLWRTAKKCADCPFASSGAGLHLRRTLRRDRWREILASLRRGESFHCHKTTDETGDGSNLVCAGSLDWQDSHGVSSQMARIAERLEWIAQRKRA